MRQDADLLKKRYGSVNLDRFETDIIDALARYTGLEKSALIRALIMRAALDTLGLGDLSELEMVISSMSVSQPTANVH